VSSDSAKFLVFYEETPTKGDDYDTSRDSLDETTRSKRAKLDYDAFSNKLK